MQQPSIYTVYSRAVAAPLMNWFLEHTYVEAAPVSGAPSYFFTCYDQAGVNLGAPAHGIVNTFGTMASFATLGPFDALFSRAMVNAADLQAGIVPPPHHLYPANIVYCAATDVCNIDYSRDGVCHQMTNRLVALTGNIIDFNNVQGARLSHMIFGSLGKRLPNYLNTVVNVYTSRPPAASANTAEFNEFVQKLHDTLIEANDSKLAKTLIDLDFRSGIDDESILIEKRFYAFMDDSFKLRYDGTYEHVDKGIVDELYESYKEFFQQKASLENADIENKGPIPSSQYAKGFDGILQKMLSRFNDLLNTQQYNWLFNQDYCKNFTFFPKGEYECLD